MDIQVKNLNKSFNKQQVLNDVDMTFPEGRITCIMGPSGIGKTTLVYILMGLLKADSGQVIGLEERSLQPFFRRIG